MNTFTERDCLHRDYLPMIKQEEDQELTLCAEDYSLLTDLYQLTMAACYTGEGLAQRPAAFELFVRKLPPGFGYLIAMGLAQALDYLQKFRFTSCQLEALQRTGIFDSAPAEFWSLLAQGRFTGDVWAVAEGTAVFANEPLLRVDAPLWQAQLVETYLLNTINYQTLVATRAARLRDVAGETATLLEFGTRRAFSPQAAIWAARAAIAGGLNGTSNVLAALKLGRNPSGTMAHALVMAIASLRGSEQAAFTAFYRYFDGSPLLIDTYDTVTAAEVLAQRVQRGEIEVSGVRLDSGNLVELSQKVRLLLPDVTIFASGDLDEYEITKLQKAGACIDGYGLGTKLVTGTPVNGVYKLVEIDGIATMKQSSNKLTYPGRKQIYRQFIEGKSIKDRLAIASELPDQHEQPLLQLVMKQGEVVQFPETLADIQKRTLASVHSLSEVTRQFENPTQLPVEISEQLEQLTSSTQQRQNIEASAFSANH
jgi:nicotinate phosphoribosyltransferase